MTRSDLIRAGALYFPLVLSCIAGLVLGKKSATPVFHFAC